jgi:hypothetical protein
MSKELFTGYLSPIYSESLDDFGKSCKLPRSGGAILKRRIPGFKYYDAMGIYPLFTCRDWTKLYVDLNDLRDEIVCLSLVTDPFGNYDERYLRYCFPDKLIPYKNHFVIDLNYSLQTFVSKHHHRNARKALKYLFVERCEEPIVFMDEWVRLYKKLIKRHNIEGIAAFSMPSFKKQLRVPGIVAFRAIYNDETVGMLLWYIQDERVGYYHLGAYSNRGYEMRASFALFWIAIEYFATVGIRWLCLGAGAGLSNNGTDGLGRFKQGWATGTRTAYFCGRIFNNDRYITITKAKSFDNSDYFPAYREGEFF